MSNNNDALESSDQRNSHRLHQQHRHAVRARKIRNQIQPSHSSRLTDQTRLPARLRRKNKSTTVQDWDEDLFDWSDDDQYSDVDYNDDSEELTQFTTKSPFTGSDAYFLDDLRRALIRDCCRRGRLPMRHNKTIIRNPHTLLTYAIDRGDPESIQVLLKNIFCGYIHRTIIDHVCSNGRTALWYACSKGNFSLVQELVELGGANINKCGILIVATQNGHAKIVDYLLSRGCDPNRRAKNYNERALHAASRRNHLDIVKALLKHGADPSILDYKKRTALDYAIHKRHNEIAKVLLYHQDDRFSMTQIGFTPLMLAACCNNIPIVDILSSTLPHQQVLDELALLACNYTIYGITSKRDQAYCYFERALSMTTPLCHTTPCEAYEFRSECQTLDELALIREDDDAMRMHALLVSERLLLKSGKVKYLHSLIMKQSDIYKWRGEFHRCLQLRLHVYQILIQTEHDHRQKLMLLENCLYALLNILSKILYENRTVPVQSLVLVWTLTVNRANNALTQILFNLLVISTYLIESKSLTDHEQRLLLALTRQTMRRNLIMPNGYTFLNNCIYRIARSDNMMFANISVPTLSMIRLLIHCGANVDEADSKTKSTPLHVISRYHGDKARSVITLLLDANAHIDCVDKQGYRPEDRAWTFEIKELLRDNRKLSLKCRCAHLINLENVCYGNYLSPNLIAFIRMHSRN